jgi:hypothetical protein
LKKIRKMRILPLIIASAAILYSCDKKETTSIENSGVATAINDSTVVAINNPTDKPALNPEHGLPYHRCDILVGAPINSAPTEISPLLAPSSPQAIAPKPGNNPAHGEPHHRCDIEVGAPLI